MSAVVVTTLPPTDSCGAPERTTTQSDSTMSVLKRLRTRVRRHGLWRTGTNLLFVVLAERCGLKFSRRFEFDRREASMPGDLSNGFEWAIATCPDDLTAADRRFLHDYGEEAAFQSRLTDGHRCLIIRTTRGDLASVCWFGPVDDADEFGSDNGGIIERCFTRHDYRGLGLYPWSLRHIATSDDPEISMHSRRLFIECSPFNHASERGITRAGFIPLCTMLQLRGWVMFSRPVKSRSSQTDRMAVR